MKFPFLSFILLSSLAPFAQTTRSKELVKKMTLDEKLSLVVGMGMNLPGFNMPSGPTVGQTMNKVPGAAGTTYPITRLGIPTTVLADGPAGLRILPTREKTTATFYATAFPVGTLLASSWDTALVKKVGQAMGNEVREYGVDILLAPALNIHRNPLGGRNFEYYSEDPVVAGNITAAMVNGIESNGVGTSIKHFAANNQETNRNQINTIVSERALREIYLKGFQIAIKKSQPLTVMSSYNRINGKYTSEDQDLLITILRKEWGFKGFVMSDWFGGSDPVAQMKAGNDMLMPGTAAQIKTIKEAVEKGTLDVKILDENVARILDVLYNSPSFKKYKFSNKPDLKAHATIARTAAADGIILLKNEGQSLPLAKKSKIAVYGTTSYDFISGGTGSGDVNEAYTVSLVDGLRNAGYLINETIKGGYESYIKTEKSKIPPKKFFFELSPPIPEMPLSDADLTKEADQTDMALITIGRNSGEFQDRKKEDDFYLTGAEKEMIRQVSIAFHAKGKKVVLILNVGGVVDVSSWRDQVDGIVLAWQGGQESGNAVADILSGSVNPSGKLTSTFPISYDDVPSRSFPGKQLSSEPVKGLGGMFMGYESEVTYDDGIYVGYRYYNSFNVKPAYEFGYGLSYTQFSYGPLKLSSTSFNGKITATMEVSNTGKSAGKEVVQIYISAPSARYSKPSEELKAFAKTGLLQRGQKQILRFEINATDLASYDSNESAWVADAGEYIVKAGASSRNILQTANFTLAKNIITERCNKVLTPQVEIKELDR